MSVIDEQKIDRVINEVSVAALQETRWFGKNVYRIEVVLYQLSALGDIPDAGRTRQRGGVVIVLSGKVAMWFQEREKLRGHDFHCMSASGEVMEKQVRSFTFIDPKKAYDSVPKEAMWIA